MLTRGQQVFRDTLAAKTGLDRRFIGAWLQAEEGGQGGPASGYEKRGYYNFLNIARTDSNLNAPGSHGSYFSDPVKAATATAEWIKGGGPITKSYGKAAPGIRALIQTAGKGAEAQIEALSKSGWASSGYDGGSVLRDLMKQQQGGATNSAGKVGRVTQSRVTQPGVTPAAAAPTTSGGVSQSAIDQMAQRRAAAGALIAKHNPNSTLARILQSGAGLPTASAPTSTPTAKTPTPDKTISSIAGKRTTTSGGVHSIQDVLGMTGTVKFDGKPVAAWVGHVLNYARDHGWTGGLSSGYRTDAEQTRIYQSGVRPAALPKSMGGGGSNHEGATYPLGAADVTNAGQLSTILKRSPYATILQYAGAKDPVHFSHPHNGSY